MNQEQLERKIELEKKKKLNDAEMQEYFNLLCLNDEMEIPEDNQEIAQHESHLTEDVEAGIEVELQERETEMDIEVAQEETLGLPQLAAAPEADTDHYLGKNGMEQSSASIYARKYGRLLSDGMTRINIIVVSFSKKDLLSIVVKNFIEIIQTPRCFELCDR